MNKLAKLISTGEITVEELASASKLIERANLVINGLTACKKTLVFPFGVNVIFCYSYTDTVGEYSAWGSCTSDGIFTCSCNWGGDHVIGRCNLNNFEEVFMAFEIDDFDHNLRRFLEQQINKAK